MFRYILKTMAEVLVKKICREYLNEDLRQRLTEMKRRLQVWVYI